MIGHYRALTPGGIIRVIISLAGLYVGVVVISLLVGTADLFLWDKFGELARGGRTLEDFFTPEEALIVFSIRLPRIIFAGIVGASLSLAGVVFQGLLRNPLADPFILGVSGGAAVGAITGILLGVGAFSLGITGTAFLGAMLAVFVVYAIAGAEKTISPHTLLLTGVMINAFFSALIMFIISVSPSSHLQHALFWLMGDLGLASKKEIFTLGAFLAGGGALIYYDARALNLITTGEETARHLGVEVGAIQKRLLIASSLVVAVAVSLSGIIGFVGLMIPHIARMIFGADHRLLLPASALLGASFLAAADTIARTVMAPVELPPGVITALAGAPYFIYLMKRKVV
ncbi:MAG: iron ABC transporter permease [Smithellaceae bacterium]|nr:iron ABC transporter permease [Smithellaceae bacterium]